MNSNSVFTKTTFIFFAVGFAASSALMANAGDRRDYKSYAKEISAIDWSDDCQGVEAIAEKDHGNWKLHVKHFSETISDIFLVDCGENDGVITCDRVTPVIDDPSGDTNCRIDRLHYGRADPGHPAAGLVLETVMLNDIKKTRAGGLLGLGKRREYTCEDAYASAKEEEARNLEKRRERKVFDQVLNSLVCISR